jgi:hypothetical protein
MAWYSYINLYLKRMFSQIQKLDLSFINSYKYAYLWSLAVLFHYTCTYLSKIMKAIWFYPNRNIFSLSEIGRENNVECIKMLYTTNMAAMFLTCTLHSKLEVASSTINVRMTWPGVYVVHDLFSLQAVWRMNKVILWMTCLRTEIVWVYFTLKNTSNAWLSLGTAICNHGNVS